MRQVFGPARPSPALVVAIVALISSLTGGAVAATLITGDDIAKNAVKSKHIANGKVKRKDLKANAVNTRKIADGSLRADDFRAGELPAGPVGPRGDKGDPGSALFANIDTNGAAAPAVGSNSGMTNVVRVNAGNYRVDFGEKGLSGCSYQVSSAEFNENQSTQVELDATDVTRLAVSVHDADAGTNVDGDFNVAAHCPPEA